MKSNSKDEKMAKSVLSNFADSEDKFANPKTLVPRLISKRNSKERAKYDPQTFVARSFFKYYYSKRFQA
jgi:hypothetical protein